MAELLWWGTWYCFVPVTSDCYNFQRWKSELSHNCDVCTTVWVMMHCCSDWMMWLLLVFHAVVHSDTGTETVYSFTGIGMNPVCACWLFSLWICFMLYSVHTNVVVNVRYVDDNSLHFVSLLIIFCIQHKYVFYPPTFSFFLWLVFLKLKIFDTLLHQHSAHPQLLVRTMQRGYGTSNVQCCMPSLHLISFIFTILHTCTYTLLLANWKSEMCLA